MNFNVLNIASLALRGVALFVLPFACWAHETTPGSPDKGTPPGNAARQEIVFEAQCEGPVVDPRQFATFRPPTHHPGGVSNPKLPESARKTGHDGRAGVSVLVNEKGRVTKARLIEPTGYPELDKVALEHTSKWKLRPATVDDKPVCAWVLFPIRFERHQATTNR